MIHYAGTHHVQINISNTTKKMIFSFHSRCVIAILPECPLAILPLIVFLAGSPCHKLYRFGDDISLAIIHNKQVNMV